MDISILQLVVGLGGFKWNLGWLYVAPFGIVMKYDPASCRMFVTIPALHSMFGDILYTICVSKGNKLLVTCGGSWWLALLSQFVDFF